MKKIILLLPLLLLFGCHVQKRRYQKGFYVNRHRPLPQQEKKNTEPVAHLSKKSNAVSLPVNDTLEWNSHVTVSGNTDLKSSLLKKQKLSFIAEPDSCDEITLRSGTTSKVKITEVTPDEVKYKRCEMLDGPLFVIKKADIFMVQYANGTREVFPVENYPSANKKVDDYRSQYDERVRHPDATIVLVYGITGLLLGYGSLRAVIIGVRALRDIRAQPLRYKGEDAVRVGIALGIIKLALLLLLILVILGISI